MPIIKLLVFVGCIWFFLFFDDKKMSAAIRRADKGAGWWMWSSSIVTLMVVLLNIWLALRTPFLLPAVVFGVALVYATMRFNRAANDAVRQGNSELARRMSRQGGVWMFALFVLYLVVILMHR